ncbi:MAG: PDZ domain-containing protein, partial [Syntrophales bacterium LBB04]|nr:PDZ domain-containing protein [Syntrophales bacterium LBB04]
VFDGVPADQAGMKSGDVVTVVNGKPIKNSHELLLRVAEFRVGETVTIKALRDSQEKTFQVKIAERKEKAEFAAGGNYFGMDVQEITPEIAKHLGVAQKSGVIVVGVKEGSPAEEAGILPQDIILQINKVKISSLKDYQREIGKAGNREGALLLIKRGKVSTFVPIRP